MTATKMGIFSSKHVYIASMRRRDYHPNCSGLVMMAAPGPDRNISLFDFIFPDLRVNLKPESFRHPPLSSRPVCANRSSRSASLPQQMAVYLYSKSCFGLLSAKPQSAALLLKPRKCCRPQPSLTAGESVKQVPYHPDLTTGYAGITPRTTATSSVRKREQP